jgi:hypothetical protein
MIDPFLFGSNIFPLLFLIVLGVILFKIFRGVAEWKHNNKQPILTVNSKVVSKRTKTSRHMHNHGGHHHVTTDYYGTFEVESGDRLELLLTGKEFGQLAEGDVGKLTFQGTRYHDFQRIHNPIK